MNPELKEIIKDVYFITTKDPHRPLFDALMPLEEGTSYNAYIVKGDEKTALIDTTYPPFIPDFIARLEDMGITNIDYIVSLHAEQDHSGGIPAILEKFPNAKVITNKKHQEISSQFLPISADKYQIIEDNDTLDLGGKTLRFKLAPWVHWPETMFAFLEEDKILFSTDFFGAHATNFADFHTDEDELIPLIKSYYAEIMMPYATFVRKNLATVKELSPTIIAPSHGPIYKNPDFIIDLYEKWSGEGKQNKVVVLGVSMYGSTQKMLDYITPKLSEFTEVIYHDAVTCNSSEFASDLIDAKGLILATSTVLAGPHPMMIAPTYLVSALKPELPYVAMLGSYSWGTIAFKTLTEMLHSLKKTTFIDPVAIKGTPNPDDLKVLDELVATIKQQH